METKIARSILILLITITVAEAGYLTLESPSEFRPYFAKINEILSKELSGNDDSRANIEKARELSNSWKLSFLPEGWRLKQTYDLFVSLEETLGKCDQRRSRILSKNFLANEAGPDFHHLYERTRKIIQRYRREHALVCREYYKTEFERLIRTHKGQVQEYQKQLEIMFKGLSLKDFVEPDEGDSESTKNLVELVTAPSRIDFASKSSTPAIDKIIDNAIEYAKITERWPIVESKIHEDQGRRIFIDASRFLFDIYLWRPCVGYLSHLSPVLEPAGFAALFQDRDQAFFIYGDETFHEALINSLLCSKLVEKKDKLFEIFSNVWSDKSSSLI